MTDAATVHRILNNTIQSLTSVIPIQFDVLAPSLTTQPYEQKELSVLIALLGDVRGRLIIDTTESTISAIGEAMFGMKIEGEMIESFTGELGNMVAGNLCTLLEKESLTLDISPPTVLTGETKFYGFSQAFKLPLNFPDSSPTNVLLTIDA
ncbi:CheY-P phosphatase CheX [Sporosarcina sp. NCCP-2716]|uniref:chemotaxis protein CheX n=1 Tax=Sporosarcina sp. NCCP-2716 TaxID=2943679 RepID=UPI00203BCBAC|nr:chemotaxis protein CheX [Sporosarcina sp. NCCP-2716]GKV67988.1 CheY-P phosphatase CheX [Sporosarcina sp. NCCP-2716]